MAVRRTTGKTTGRTTGRTSRRTLPLRESPIKADKYESKYRKTKARSQRPSGWGEYKSREAKEENKRRIKNKRAKQALSKRHPRTPEPPKYNTPRFF